MTDERHFILNENPDDIDVIHDPRTFSEQCNTDQVEGRQRVDVATAARLIAMGDARVCEHCGGEAT